MNNSESDEAEVYDYRDGKIILTIAGSSLREADLTKEVLSFADLSEEDLNSAKMSGADLSFGFLSRSDLRGAQLGGANLASADLSYADLRDTSNAGTFYHEACLFGAKLDNAILYESVFEFADLREASLRHAKLDDARFYDCRFDDADFTGASLGNTLFVACSTLVNAKGLDQIEHCRQSTLDTWTLRKCIDKLPYSFLQGCGYTQHEIDYLRALYRENSIAMYSCFISHAEADLPFAQRLLADLRQKNVTCWHYKENLRGGRDWQTQIDEAIKVHDKLILVCSRQSVYRENVVKEIIRAIDVERETGEQKLFPIRLDDHILSPSMMEEAREMVTTRVWRENWVLHIKRKHIPDFSGWDKDNAKYTQELNNLLRDLRQSA